VTSLGSAAKKERLPSPFINLIRVPQRYYIVIHIYNSIWKTFPVKALIWIPLWASTFVKLFRWLNWVISLLQSGYWRIKLKINTCLESFRSAYEQQIESSHGCYVIFCIHSLYIDLLPILEGCFPICGNHRAFIRNQGFYKLRNSIFKSASSVQHGY